MHKQGGKIQDFGDIIDLLQQAIPETLCPSQHAFWPLLATLRNH